MILSFRCGNRSDVRWCGGSVGAQSLGFNRSYRQHKTRRFLSRAEKQQWRGNVQRMQQSLLESAVSAMNGMISKLESQGRVNATEQSLNSTHMYLQSAQLDETVQTARLKIKAKASVLRPVVEVPGKGLEEYLSLPVEDYNSLDPQVVQFLGDNRFRLTPPFQKWFHINLHPEIILRIQPEPDKSRVLFVCEKIKFGDRNMDKAGGLTFVSALAREEATTGGSKGVFLVSAAQLGMTVDTPYSATHAAPMRALEVLSSRVLQATLKACMGPYLDRLLLDYEDWAEGRPRRQGQIHPEEAGQLFLEAEASVVEGVASLEAEERQRSGAEPPGERGSSSGSGAAAATSKGT